MTESKLPQAITGTEMRLDALIARVDRLCALLTPVAPPPMPEPETVELREPEASANPKRTTKAKR